ncbi:zinc finger protein Paris [Drosophila virilis]|uniref:zinc finger protein Paris n=1 Tax=Drosophila virilis TaxID=7244 RepID=UPI0038B30797
MDSVCRVCMSTVDLVDIFADGKLHDCERTLVEMLNECVKYPVTPEDELTKKICGSCISDVKIAFRLKLTADNSYKRLNMSLQADLEEFIDTLAAEDWELVNHSIKKELDDTSELENHVESVQERQNKPKKSTNSKKTFKCKTCGKAFNKNAHLITHNRIHTSERPFRCLKCPKTFAQSSSLKTHQIVHTGERMYKCPHCPKDFSRKYHLNKHLINHSVLIETSIRKQYKCNVCSKTFKSNDHLSRHIRSHTGERPFKCSECSKAFTQASSLKTHQIVHTGERRYKCPHCPKDFTRNHNLVSHLRHHASIKEAKRKLRNRNKAVQNKIKK